mmetsp:Transcript_44932/g.95803  ORF Transcript_44932/g.95803 Transcript_44932/m.95803 type:complete len:240 (+) Transcript_44932:289-1008(+)
MCTAGQAGKASWDLAFASSASASCCSNSSARINNASAFQVAAAWPWRSCARLVDSSSKRVPKSFACSLTTTRRPSRSAIAFFVASPRLSSAFRSSSTSRCVAAAAAIASAPRARSICRQPASDVSSFRRISCAAAAAPSARLSFNDSAANSALNAPIDSRSEALFRSWASSLQAAATAAEACACSSSSRRHRASSAAAALRRHSSSRCRFTSQGRVKVYSVRPGPPAAQGGLANVFMRL